MYVPSFSSIASTLWSALPSARLSTPREMAAKIKMVAIPAILTVGAYSVGEAEAGFGFFTVCMAACTAATGGALVPACVAACVGTLAAPIP